MKAILISCCFFCITNSYAQRFSVSIMQGVTLPLRYSPNIPDVNYILPENKRVTYLAYLNLKYDVNNLLSLKSGIMLETRGWYSRTFTNDPVDGSTTIVKALFSYRFLTVPFLLEINTGTKSNIFINGGINTSLRTGGVIRIENKNVQSLDFVHPEDKSPKIDFSGTIGIGTAIHINERTKILFEGNYFRSITPIGTREAIEEEIFHKGYRISIGVNYLIN